MQTFKYGNPESENILIQMVDDHDLEFIDSEVQHIQNLTENADFCLYAFKCNNWNADLSPWPSSAVFGKEDFKGKAEETLALIINEHIPSIEKTAGTSKKRYFIGGYSLAGLFALWAAYNTDLFSGVAAASPSVWFPGFTDYAKEHPLHSKAIYLSLGNKEEKTRNPVMAKVGECIRDLHLHLDSSGIPCILEWNEGNHFKEPDLRTARAFAWLLNQSI